MGRNPVCHQVQCCNGIALPRDFSHLVLFFLDFVFHTFLCHFFLGGSNMFKYRWFYYLRRYYFVSHTLLFRLFFSSFYFFNNHAVMAIRLEGSDALYKGLFVELAADVVEVVTKATFKRLVEYYLGHLFVAGDDLDDSVSCQIAYRIFFAHRAALLALLSIPRRCNAC